MGEKYILIKPELFKSDTNDLKIIKEALRSHSNSYMQQVFSHLTTGMRVLHDNNNVIAAHKELVDHG